MLSCVEFTVTMDAKDLRTESALSDRNNDGSKYSQSGGIAIHCDRNKSYQDIGSKSLAKVDVQSGRPCAVIGPDRVVPPPAPSESYLKKGPVEPWSCMDNAYHTRRPPEYPHKLANFHNPTRNISPRQTFQENMQRIMVPPSYNSVKISDDNYVQMSDRSNALPKNIKINVPPEAKFCDVPYTVYPNSNDQKNLRMPEICMPSANPTLSRTAPHGWLPGSVNVRPTRTYGAPEIYQYPDYSSCAGPRPVVPRPNRTVPEESGYVYADPFYHQEGNIRFKPYPTVKDRFPQQRYEYIGNYPNSFHPPPTFPTHKFELQKTVPPHHYPSYPPIKYMDRVPEPVVEGYPRNQQSGYNIPYRNQIIHPNYGPVIGNCPQNKIHSYPPDAHIKTVPANKLPFDNNKAYTEYENGRPKMYSPSETYLVNEIGKMHPMKSQIIMPNYPTLNMHNTPQHPYFKKDSQQMKNYEYIHYRNMDPNINIHNPMVRHPPVFSPNTSAISPTDSSASNDTLQTLGTSQEDCGYVSQSSTASARSIDSSINRTPTDYCRKYYDSRFGPIIRNAHVMSKSELNSNNSKEKKNLDVRQFLQMWNEGDEEAEENHSKNITAQAGLKNDNNFGKSHEVINQPNQEQLYVLGLVNVPSEELAKYEHIQKVSKLPENIKGYNHIELLNQFEEAIEFSNMTNYKASTPRDFQIPLKAVPPKQTTGLVPPRPLSPLDVEAKISQSVIHKEVGCNFEIKPCSPKMLNVEIATPVQNILAERSIEKVANPVMLKSPRINGIDENIDCNMKRKDLRMNMSNESARIQSCKMVNAQFSNNNLDLIKNSYSLQDLESNSGLCLASLPRLDNDIELNFPEVNQQFINANKGESSVSSSHRDLPSLELVDNSNSQIKDKLNDINPTGDVLKSPCIIDSEKEFVKLSKFRKSKSHTSDTKEYQTNHVINAARTDSVIIKNPENIKNYEEKSIFSPSCLNKQTEDIQQDPINLTAQEIIAVDTPAIIKPNDSSEVKDTSIDIAIDFSLNKNSSNESVDCIVKNDKSSAPFTNKSIETKHFILNDHLNKLSSFSACDDHIQVTLTDHNKIEDNFIPSPIKYDVRESVPEFRNDEICKEKPILENPPLKCSSSTPGVNQTKDEDDSSLTAIPMIETNDVISDSLLPIEFETPVVELLRTSNYDNAVSQMVTDKDSDIAELNLDKRDNNVAEDYLDNDVKNKQEFSIVAAATIENVKVFDNDSVAVSAVKKAMTDPVLDIEATQNNDVSRSTVSSVNIGSDSNNSNYTNNEKIGNNVIQTENTKQNADLNFDLPPPNIVAHSQDEKIENTNEESDFNLSSYNSGMSPNSGRSKVNKPEADFENNTPLSNENVATYSPKDYQSDKVQQDTDFNLSSHNRNPLTSNREVCQLETFEGEKDLILASPHTMAPTSPKDYDEEITKEKRVSNIYSLSSNNTIYSPKNNLLDFTESNESYLPAKSDYDVTVTTDLCGLSEDASSYKIDLPSTEKCCEDIIVRNKEEVQTLESPLKKEIDQLIRQTKGYLSYGSKEMYSPWIQKLIMYCEGNTKNIYLRTVDDIGTSCSLTKTNIIDVSTSSVSCLEEEMDTVSNESDSNHNIYSKNRSFSIQSNSETTKPSDTLTIGEYSSVKIDNTNNEEVKNTENKDYNISDDDELSNTSMTQENDICNSLVENVQYALDQTNETSANLSKINEQLCDKLDSQSDRSPNASVNVSCICSKANQQSSKHCDCSNNTNNQLGKKYDKNGDVTKLWDEPCYSNDDIIKQNDTGSNCIDEKPESWDKKSCNSDVSEERDKQLNCNDEVIEEWYNESERNIDTPEPGDKQSNTGDKTPQRWEEQPNCSAEAPAHWGKQSNRNNQKPEHWDKKSNCSNGKLEQWDKQSNFSDDNLDQWDKQSNCSDDKLDQSDEQSNSSDDTPEQWDKEFNRSDDKSESHKRINCNDEAPERWDKQTNMDEGKTEHSDRQPDSNDSNSNELESSTTLKNNKNSSTEVDTTVHDFLYKKRQPLKRSLSDTALNIYSNNENASQEKQENLQFIWPFKRRKINNIHNDILAQNLCNIIQNNRRNSISAMYNEENVSLCILIENDCIITEEENDEQEKMCYTELPEECLAQIQNDCTKDVEEEEHVESMTEVISTLNHESDCEYSDSFVMQNENEKLEESWVEDVACVETVISDDVAEDIEISGSSSPKDDSLSENDESGVFSSSEHTDKVKYIYGDKMCNDDAQFVETLYNTPQMDVSKTLVQRVNQISGEYYDNDSLEKILSESNEPALSPYVPEYTEPVYSPGLMDVKETVANKENMDIDVISPLQSKCNSLHFVDMGIHNIDHENVNLGQLFDENQNDTVHSCESSVDNVFTYKQNDKNKTTTSSSPEVSSTTSEEKNSAILLKITSYKGSRISQVNGISTDRPSCKFTEDKDYVQSHSNIPLHRPLLTKAAQKYIPPLKESMRDLKVKLSLPQHSLMKLKQLKISKDEPKVCKPNVSVPRTSKKPKPKFEDVLKSIDDIQIKMHKQKTKKSKKCIPKVVIKKNDNGSHYASTSKKDEFNPDLTGRKWQPWVFIEKNHFIDKMAIKKKTKAIFSHRKRTYVLAEKFQKYKSVNSAKFVISPPISDCPSTGLKYTIRLKHNY